MKSGSKGPGANPDKQGLFTPDENCFTEQTNLDYQEGPPENLKKRKVSEHETESSEDEAAFAREDPTLVANLIAGANEANARADEMEELAMMQANNVHLLAHVAGIPEADIDSISLAQEITEDQIAAAQGEHIPSVPGGSGSSRS